MAFLVVHTHNDKGERRKRGRMTDSGDPNDRDRLGRDPGSEGGGAGGGMDRDPDRGDAGGDRMAYGSDRKNVDRDRAGTGHGGVENPNRGRGWGIAALIVSILALLGSIFAFLNLILAVPGLILGIAALVKGSRGFGIAAIILSIVAIVIGILITIFVGAAIINDPQFQQLLQEAEQQSQ
jgi:hypothetical protein